MVRFRNNSYTFGSEIEAHADLLVNKTKLAKFIKYGRQIQKKQSDESYFYSVGIADMAQGDRWQFDKVLMDTLWGRSPVEDTDILEKENFYIY